MCNNKKGVGYDYVSYLTKANKYIWSKHNVTESIYVIVFH